MSKNFNVKPKIPHNVRQQRDTYLESKARSEKAKFKPGEYFDWDSLTKKDNEITEYKESFFEKYLAIIFIGSVIVVLLLFMLYMGFTYGWNG